MKEIHTLTCGVTNIREIGKDLLKDGFVLSEEDIEDYMKLVDGNYSKAILYANRFESPEMLRLEQKTSINKMIKPDFLLKHSPELKKGGNVILSVIEKKGHILFVTDSDTDGVTSAAIGDMCASKLLNYHNYDILVNTRSYGNGVNDILTKKIEKYNKAKPIDLIITSDHGSSDKKNLTYLKETLGCKVIVTDHHPFKEENAPHNMDAFINPQKQKELFQNLTGSHVLFNLMVYTNYLKYGTYNLQTLNTIHRLIDYVALTIISDCMDLKNYVNRKFVNKMLQHVNNKNSKLTPFWEYVRNLAGYNGVDTDFLSFKVIPKLNSPGRIGDAYISYKMLVAKNIDEAVSIDEEMSIINEDRKNIQQKVREDRNQKVLQNGTVKLTLVDNANGIQGIIANDAIYNDNFMLSIVFTPNNNGKILVGSGRSVMRDVAITELLNDIKKESDIIIKAGGHKHAVGLRIKNDLEGFYKLLVNKLDERKVKAEKFIPVDAYIFSIRSLIKMFTNISETGPYGTGFPKPNFVSDVLVSKKRIVKKPGKNYLILDVIMFKDSKTRLSLFYPIPNKEYENIDKNLKPGSIIRVGYNVNVNIFRKRHNLQMLPFSLRILQS